jgi:hypothetical protein
MPTSYSEHLVLRPLPGHHQGASFPQYSHFSTFHRKIFFRDGLSKLHSPFFYSKSQLLKNGCLQYYYYYLVCEAIGTAATPGLLCQHRVIVKMIVEKQTECRLCRGNRSSRRENLPQRHFCPSQNPT